MMHSLRSFCYGIALSTACSAPLVSVSKSCLADEEEAVDGPWISSLIWADDSTIIGTHSQGLLLRPASLVKVDAATLDKHEQIGESATSLWSVLNAGDGKYLTTDYKGGIHVLGSDSPARVEADCRWIRATKKAPTGEVLAGTEDGKLVVLSLSEMKEVRRIDAHEAAIFDIEVNEAGDQVATAGGDGKIKVFSWPALEPVAEMSRGNESIWSVAFSHDGKRLVSGGADRRIQLWDLEAKQSVCTITKTSDWVTDLEVMPDSTVVVASCMSGQLVVVDYDAILKVTTHDVAKSAIWDAELSPDAKRIAVGTRKHGIALVDLPDWKTMASEAAGEASKIRPPSPK